MNKLAIAAIDIEDADLDFIQYTCRGKLYNLDIDLDLYLKDSGVLECSEDKWSYSSESHYTNDWSITVDMYLEGISIYDVALDYIRDTFNSIDRLIEASEEIE